MEGLQSWPSSSPPIREVFDKGSEYASLSPTPRPHQYLLFFTHGNNLTIWRTKGEEYKYVLFPKRCIYFTWEVIGQGRNGKNVEGARKAFKVVDLSRVKSQAVARVPYGKKPRATLEGGLHRWVWGGDPVRMPIKGRRVKIIYLFWWKTKTRSESISA